LVPSLVWRVFTAGEKRTQIGFQVFKLGTASPLQSHRPSFSDSVDRLSAHWMAASLKDISRFNRIGGMLKLQLG
jgi:hypothetical protein